MFSSTLLKEQKIMRPYYINLILIIILLCLTSTTTTTIINAGPVPKNEARRQFLGIQNAARKVLGLRPLRWSPKLARYARSYAYERRSDCALEHSHGPYGENIFWGSGDGWTPAQASAAWVAERLAYNYWSNSCAGGQQCGHYTQIVWRDTRKVGCARVVCGGGKGVFMTCNYDPPGNYIGERPY